MVSEQKLTLLHWLQKILLHSLIKTANFHQFYSRFLEPTLNPHQSYNVAEQGTSLSRKVIDVERVLPNWLRKGLPSVCMLKTRTASSF